MVHREVAHIRIIAGMDISKDQKEAENENEALSDLEHDRLQLKDLIGPLAPVLPDKYLQASGRETSPSEGDSDKETNWEKIDSKLER
jgi:hypothetical protein